MIQSEGSDRRVALVTGGTRGIGKSICERLTAMGVTVIATGIQARSVEERNGEQNPNAVLTLQADISNEASVDSLFAEISARFGRLDILVNNAGISLKVDGKKPEVETTSTEFWTRHLAVNLTGTFLCCRAAVPLLRRSKSGRIVQIGSQAGRMYTGFASAAYSASKAGLIGFSRVLAGEVGQYGITVNVVAPTRTATDMALMFSSPQEMDRIYSERTPMKRVAVPEDVAAAVAYLVSEDAGYVTGTIIDVTGGFFMP